MDNAGYTALTRQGGLQRELQVIANNIANISTTGFRKEGILFSEYIHAMDDGSPSLSMASANVRATSYTQGPLTQTGGSFDFAIEGGGFFLIETPDGQQLTRNGAFTPNGDGELVAADGAALLDNGGARVFIPPDAKSISLASDGTLSADGTPLTQIGLYRPSDPAGANRRDGVRFSAEEGVEPADDGALLQGFLENSNVNAITEIARMIQVQHAYELGQTFLEKEDQRIRGVLQTLGR